jgi:hypothetical protein
MSWKTENFRSESYHLRAVALRNQGISPNPHKSWADAAKARRKATEAVQRDEQKNWDNFDHYLARVRAMVAAWEPYVPPEAQAARDELADEIPF